MMKNNNNNKYIANESRRKGQQSRCDDTSTFLLINRKFYGDIVNGLWITVALPFFAWKLLMIISFGSNDDNYEDDDNEQSQNNNNNNLSVVVATLFCMSGITAFFSISSWMYDDLLCSRLAFLGNLIAGTYMELKEWPVKGTCTITPRFTAGVFILCLANIPLSFHEKVIRSILIFIVGSCVSIFSPYSIYEQDALPYLGGTVVITILALSFFQYNINNGVIQKIQREEVIVHGARLILGGIFVHHTFKLLLNVITYRDEKKDNLIEQVTALMTSGVIASVGSVATGVFKTNIDHKEQLEVLVRQRTKEIRNKNIELNRVHVAFTACSTAEVIVDHLGRIVWMNPAFQSLVVVANPNTSRCNATTTTSDNDNNTMMIVGQPLTDVIRLKNRNEQQRLKGVLKLDNNNSFVVSPLLLQRQDDNVFEITDNNYYRLQVTPFHDHDDDNDDENNNIVNSSSSNSNNNDNRNHHHHQSFLVAFHNITADRARERAENNAREEAMLSKAMKESMVTLTHELRTPLQGIMGITSIMLQQHQQQQQNHQSVAAATGGEDSDNSSSDDTNNNKETEESLGLIMASSSLLLNLINNLLDVKKAAANMMDEFTLTSVHASDTIQDAIDFCKPLASISNVNIAMDSNSIVGATTTATSSSSSMCVDYDDNNFVVANSLRLQQVLINMISNAIKYTARDSTIRIRTRSSTLQDLENTMKNDDLVVASSFGDTAPAAAAAAAASDNTSAIEEEGASSSPTPVIPVLVFSVSDAGPGIDPRQGKNLFSRFARLENNEGRTLGTNKVGQPSGTGLGLNLCYMFVQRMNGQIWASNNNGNDSKNNDDDGSSSGSTFSFYLPLVPKEAIIHTRRDDDSLNQVSSSSTHQQITVPPNNNNNDDSSSSSLIFHQDPAVESVIDLALYRVLVVDDTLINRKVFDRMLKKIGVVNVKLVESGEKALVELSTTSSSNSNNRYDLIITDLQMPGGMSGTDLSRKIIHDEEAAFSNDSMGEKKTTSSRTPPIVIGLTADTSPDVREKCAVSGMSDLLYKPITVAEMKDYFRSRIKQLEPGVWVHTKYGRRRSLTINSEMHAKY